MYTGIVQGIELVTSIQENNGYNTISISNNNGFFDDVIIGASVAINGVCLTVTGTDINRVTFDVSALTLQSTTLKNLRVNEKINIERSCRMGSENGGHSLYGHIEGVAFIKDVIQNSETRKVIVNIPDGNIKYFFQKGFIGLHGCSLTINEIDREKNTVSLNLIPETLRLTTLAHLRPGDQVNYEIEQSTRAIVDTLLSTLGNITH
ncbi:riboflavin synthase subunit alpha [Salmonella enterica subsp. enterica serovar Infantis]|uniref:Riboflavin synthase n=1 Tax=Salmonella enterica subsp. enterica serovar Karamoja TaxID=2500153 RepID=A0A3Q9MQE3_SALET|nr:riboflavin synthase subunit alpha [Salmonella enterica]AZT39609.1 riboflavin synthase subunit alpha [Salmonella enterica subsp. enterica serovar Karamoja]AZT44308.1 riboflavin synthase subunit alpha [Salmonella enterica subsp. enterica serovar Karamoja]EBZ0493678.1 riboflavin synthase subunit alpha [Salmonella enterica subsp. enterica serovar Infantis]EGI5923475.1 riboflavin synthase subunit alpha [Salmonella enterica subsp. enterica serovar Colindale]